MADANFRSEQTQIGLTHHLIGIDRTDTSLADAASVMVVTDFIQLVLTNPTATLSDNQKQAFRTALGVVNGLTQTQVDARVSAVGVSVTSGSGAPDNANGKEHDLYVRTGGGTDGGLYYRSSSAWSHVASRTAAGTSLTLVSQDDAEAGTSTTAHSWSPQRVKQAIDALGISVTVSASEPSAPRAGDIWQRTGNTSPGLYIRLANSWSTVTTGADHSGGHWSSGSAMPNDANGDDGDFYFRTGNTGQGIWLKQSGTWNHVFETTSGDITSVGAGSGLTGGGTTGAVTLNVGAGQGIEASANAITVKLDGTTLTKAAGGLSVTNPRPTAATQVEAEAGTVTALRSWTPERVRQAIGALAPGSKWGTGDATPSGGAEGDWYLRTGTSDPGIYYHGSSGWSRIFQDTTGGGSGGGNVDGVTAGHGLTGGGSSGTVTLNVNVGDGIKIDNDKVAADVGNGIEISSEKLAVKLDGDSLTVGSSGLSVTRALSASDRTMLNAALTGVTAGTGLSSTTSGSTITLNVEVPYSATERLKLSNIEENAKDDQTPAEIIGGFGGYTGSDRIPARLISGLAAGGNHPERSGDVDIPGSVVIAATGYANPDILDCIVADGLVWLLQDRPGSSTARLRAFDPTDDSHQSSRDISLTTSNPKACFHDGAHVWVIDHHNRVECRLLSSGSHVSARDVRDDAGGTPWLEAANASLDVAGATLEGDDLWVADADSDSIYMFDFGTQGEAHYQSHRSLRGAEDVRNVVAGGSAGNITPAGVTVYDGTLYLLDAHRDIIFAWDAAVNSAGRPERLHSHDFSQDLVRSASATIVPSGCATDGVHLWISNNRGGSDQNTAGDTDDKKIFGFSIPAVIHGGLNEAQVDARIAHYGQPYTDAEQTKLSGIDAGAEVNPTIGDGAPDNSAGDNGDWAVVYGSSNPGVYEKVSGTWTRRLAVESRRTAAQIATILNALSGSERVSYDSLKDAPEQGSSSELFTGTGTTYKLWTAAGIRTAVHAHRITVRHGSSDPANSLGASGDTYFKTASGNVTEIWLRGSSSWTKIANFSTGSDGPTWHYATSGPTQNVSNGDYWLKPDGQAAPGIYHREGGSWVLRLAPGSGGGSNPGQGVVYGVFRRDSDADVTQTVLRGINSGFTPVGGFSDETRFWVIDSESNTARAFLAADSSRDADSDLPSSVFEAANASISPKGGFAAHGIAWIVDTQADAAWAINIATKQRSSAHDLTSQLLASVSNLVPEGGFTDGTTAWIVGRSGGLYAFTLPVDGATAARDSAKDILYQSDLGLNIQPSGGWSDGRRAWIVSGSTDITYGVHLAAKTRDSLSDLTNEVMRSANQNISPTGGWSVGGRAWIADNNADAAWAFDRLAEESDLTDFLDRDDLVAGANITITPGSGNSVTIASTGGGDDTDSDIAEKFVGVAESSDDSVNLNNREIRGRLPGSQTYLTNEDFKGRGGATDGTRTWICDQDGRRVRGYHTLRGGVARHLSDADVPASLLATDATLVGCAYADNMLWVADSTNREIRSLDVSGLSADPATAITRDTTKQLLTAALTPANTGIVVAGVFTDGTHLWVLDSNMDAAWAWLISSMARDSTKDFTQAQLRAASTTINPSGGFVAEGHTYITDLHSNGVFTFDNDSHAHTPDYDLSANTLEAAKPQDTRVGNVRPYGGWALNHRIAIMDGGDAQNGSYVGVYGFYAAHTIISHIIEDLQKKLGPRSITLNANAEAGLTLDPGYSTLTIGAGGHTNQEITTGTSGSRRMVSPADMKLAAETHGGSTDVSDKLERSDLVAGTNITLTPGSGRTVTIASTASGGGGGRALVGEEEAEHGLGTTPYAWSPERIQQAIDSRAPGQYITPAIRWRDRSADITLTGKTIEGVVSNGTTAWLIGADDALTAYTIAGWAADTGKNLTSSNIRQASNDIQPVSGFFVGDILSIVDRNADAIYGYNLDGTRSSVAVNNWTSAEVRKTLAHNAITPEDAFTDGEFLWLLLSEGSVLCYRLSDKSRVESKDLDRLSMDIAPGFAPVAGFTSPNNSYGWVVNGTTRIAHCFHLATMRREDDRDIPASIVTAGRSGATIRGAFSAGNFGFVLAQKSGGGAYINAFRLPTAQADHYPIVSEAEAKAGTGIEPRIYTPQRVAQQVEGPVMDAVITASRDLRVWNRAQGNPTVTTAIGGRKTFDVNASADRVSGGAIPAHSTSGSYSTGDLVVSQEGRVFRALASGNNSVAPPTRSDTNPDLNTKWELASGWRTDKGGAVVLGDANVNSNAFFDFTPPAGQYSLGESLVYVVSLKWSDPFQAGFWIGFGANGVTASQGNNTQDRGLQFYVNLKRLTHTNADAVRGVYLEPKIPGPNKDTSTSENRSVAYPRSGEWTYFNGAGPITHTISGISDAQRRRFIKLPVWSTGNGTDETDPERTLMFVHHHGVMALYADNIRYGEWEFDADNYPFRKNTSGSDEGEYELGVGNRFTIQSQMQADGTRQLLLTRFYVGKPRPSEKGGPEVEPFDLRRLEVPTDAGRYDVQFVSTVAHGAGKLDFTPPPAEVPLTVVDAVPGTTAGNVGDVRLVAGAAGHASNGVYVRQTTGWVRIAS